MKRILLLLGLAATLTACQSNPTVTESETAYADSLWWPTSFRSFLPQLGHRNWILVVDQAFPAQTAPGIFVLNTDTPLPAVLDTVLSAVSQSGYLRPVVYTDAELNHLTDSLAPGVEAFRTALHQTIDSYSPKTLLHNEVFGKLDEASKLFQIIVLKTNTKLPYTSVFIELDCGYWSAEKEEALRTRMKK